MPTKPDLRACATAAFEDGARFSEISLREDRVEWDRDGYVGFAAKVGLRSGMELVISEGRAERATRIAFQGDVEELMLTLSRGTGIHYAVTGGPSFLCGGGALEVTCIRQAVTIESTLAAGAHNEFIVLSLTRPLMCELLDVAALPSVIEDVLGSAEHYAHASVPMSVELFRLLDELLRCATEGTVRELYLEAKGLELLARIFEQLEAQPGSDVAIIPKGDLGRLHQVRDRLVARMTDPPSLDELAREVGLNRTKLKAEFRSLFGVPVYAYLRDYRMSEAHRLLLGGDLNVTEVASKVGYANPSKFAAAFRRHFGFAPSEARG